MKPVKARRLLVVLALMVAACSDSAFVETITIVNETGYPAHVEVSDASREEWLGLTVGKQDSETAVEQVIDQGELWVFRFDYAGKHREEIEIPRAELKESNWRVIVPASFGEALGRKGIQPPP